MSIFKKKGAVTAGAAATPQSNAYYPVVCPAPNSNTPVPETVGAQPPGFIPPVGATPPPVGVIFWILTFFDLLALQSWLF